MVVTIRKQVMRVPRRP
jgi:hypothetical protein